MMNKKLRPLLVDEEKEFVQGFLEERRTALTCVAANDFYHDLCNPDQSDQILLNMNQSFGGFVDLRVSDAADTQPYYVGRYPG